MAVRDKVKADKGKRKQSLRGTVVQRKRDNSENRRFLTMRVWINYLLGMFAKDRGKIPDNINNNLLIMNNMYATKSYLSSIIQIVDLSLDTPTTFVQELIEYVRKGKSKAVIDVSIKNIQYDVKLKDAGLESRVEMWQKMLTNPLLSEHEKQIAARCLYTKKIAESGQKLYMSRIFITVREKTASKVIEAEKLVIKYLNSIGASYLRINGNVEEVLSYMSIISDYKFKEVKDYKAIITSNTTLAQMMPNTNSPGKKVGQYWGVNITNGSLFREDLSDVTLARNLYLIAPSGVGKTVFATNIAQAYVESNYAICMQDIKGNEACELIEGIGGYVVSLTLDSTEYINSFVMRKEETTDMNAEAYFKDRIEFSKDTMIILSGAKDSSQINTISAMLDEFLTSLYTIYGVKPNNRNTWKHTLNLDPFMVFDCLSEWLSKQKNSAYLKIAKDVLPKWRMYMSKSGSRSRMFLREFKYLDIMKSKGLSFNFGMLQESYSKEDMVIFRLKFKYMSKLNSDYVAYKYSKGIRILKVLEESQIVAQYPDIIKSYVEDFTLRRAQNQDSLLIGNAVSALMDSEIAQALLENVTGLLIGQLSRDAMKEVIRKFSLEEQQDLLWSLGSDEKHSNAFVYIDKMHERPIIPILKVILNKNKKYKVFTPRKISMYE